MDFEFLKDRYDFELQRKEQLNAALTLPVAVLSGLGGAIVAMARSFTYSGEFLTRAFLIALGLDLAAFLVCLVCLGLSYHRQWYWYLERLATLEAWKDDYAEFLRARGLPVDSSTPVKEDLRARIIEAADRNTANNDRRTKDLYWARNALFAALSLTAAAGIPYVVDQVRYQMPKDQKPHPPAPQNGPRPLPPPPPPNRTFLG